MNHQKFLHRLDASEPGVLKVSEWLTMNGIENIPLKMKKAPQADQWRQYVDKGDILALVHGNFEYIGAKRRGPEIKFSLQGFQYPTMFLWSVQNFDESKKKPLALFILNHAMDCGVIAWTCHKTLWTLEWCHDPHYGPDHRELHYVIEMRHLQILKWGSPIAFPAPPL